MADVTRIRRFQGVMTTLLQPRRVTPPGTEPADELEAFQALAHQARQLGVAETARHLADFDNHYRDMYHEGQRDVSPLLQLALQLSEPLPHEGPLEANHGQILLELAIELVSCACEDRP